MDELKLKGIKRACFMCHTYRGQVTRTTNYKKDVEDALSKLQESFLDEYNKLRASDASIERIKAAQANRYLCRDALDTCKACNKQADSVNRILNALK